MGAMAMPVTPHRAYQVVEKRISYAFFNSPVRSMPGLSPDESSAHALAPVEATLLGRASVVFFNTLLWGAPTERGTYATLVR
ncbi:MAG: hypothetical protein ACREO8_01970 [Luteimonas sp.]